MRRHALLAALVFCLALAAPAFAPNALAVEPFLTLPDQPELATPDQAGQATTSQPALAPQEQPAPKLQAHAPIHMDQALAREHERFSHFAHEQMRRMNDNIIGGRHAMQVRKHHDGRYHASYKAIDLEDIICQVRRSENNPNYYVGSVLYKEIILESVAEAPEACRKGPFVRVSEQPSRIIYSSKHGGGWQ